MDNQQPSQIKMNDLIQCRICGKSFQTLGSHLTFVHKINCMDYKIRFEGAETDSESIRKTRSESAKKPWTNLEFKERRSQQVSKDMVARWSDSEFKESQSKAISTGIMNTDYEERVTKLQSNCIYQGKGWRRYTDRKDRQFSFRSSWELGFAILVDILELDWEYEYYRFMDQDNSIYTPDFYVHDFNSFFEVKCYFEDITPEDVRDRLSYVSITRQIKISIIDEIECNEFLSLVFSLIPEDKIFKFDLGRFNDYPLCGSTAKRLEVRRYLESLPGIRYSLSMHSNMQTVSDDCVTEVAFGS